MDKKRKLTSKPTGNIKSPKEKEVDLIKEDDVILCETKEKTNINKSLANICHKKSFGANNWRTFIESLPKQNAAEIKEKQNNKPNHLNKFNTMGQRNKKNITDPNYTSANSSNKNIKKKGLNNFKFANEKPVLNVNKLLEPKQTENKEPKLTKQIAMDCEMVGVEIGVNKSMLARISLVNALGDCVYDKFVKPTEPVLDYRTRVSGVRSTDLENAEDFKTVQKEVADILKGRILVGHALKNDLKVLFLSHPRRAIRDTSKFKKFREGKTPSLKKLAKKYLDVVIQEGEHSSVEDALAAMQLYRMVRGEWEATFRPSGISKCTGKVHKAPNYQLQMDA